MITFSDVSAVLVTRGDVDLKPIIDSLPYNDIVVWDNSKRKIDLKAYGRYAAIYEAKNNIIYFQDDDCLFTEHEKLLQEYEPNTLVCNMPESRWEEYHDSGLIGYGSLHDRGMAERTFLSYYLFYEPDDDFDSIGADIIFPLLSKVKKVDLGHTSFDYAYGDNRTYTRPDYVEKRALFRSRGRALKQIYG